MRKHPCILVGLDPEGTAGGALELAEALAPHFGAEVYALRVNEADDADDRETGTPGLAETTKLIERTGTPLDRIADTVRELAASLLVLGPHQKGRHHSLLGGTAQRLIRTHPCPVLVHRGATAKPYGTLLVAVDASSEAQGALRCARDWALALGADLHLVNVFEPPDFVYEAGNPAIPSYTVEAMESDAQGALDERLSGMDWDGVSLTQHHPKGAPSDEILRIAGEIRADLVVMGGRRHSALETLLIGTTADSVLRGTEASVLVV